MPRPAAALALALFASVCALSVSTYAADKAAPAVEVLKAKRFGAWGVDLTGMDLSIKPGDDFFAYGVGAANRRTVIPADQSTYGVNEALSDLAEAQSRAIVEGLSRQAVTPGQPPLSAKCRSATRPMAGPSCRSTPWVNSGSRVRRW